jgi:hypothetical protein
VGAHYPVAPKSNRRARSSRAWSRLSRRSRSTVDFSNSTVVGAGRSFRAGAMLAQQLVSAGEHVVDVPPKLSSRMRLLERGRIHKIDPNDARQR